MRQLDTLGVIIQARIASRSEGELRDMKSFVEWLSDHTLATILVLGTVYAVWFVIAHRKSLFYKE